MLSSKGSSQPRKGTQGIPHCRQILYHLSHQGSPRILQWVPYPFSRGSSQPRNWTRVSCIAGDSLPAELLGKPGDKQKLKQWLAIWWYWALLQTAKTRLGADCASDNELLIAKFRLKLKKVGKTTKPFRYDINQIPDDYTVEVTNRFRGPHLIQCLMNYGQRFMTLYRRQGLRPSSGKRNSKKQNGCLRRPYK